MTTLENALPRALPAGSRPAVPAAGRDRRSGPVDALRCLAMTAVVAQHCGLLPFGWTGVWLFFVISGYVVTVSVLGRGSELPAGRRLKDFFARRIRRIVPVYYAYVGAGLLTAVLVGSTLDPLAVASLLGFFNNGAMALGRGEIGPWPVGHLWTISVEMQFYLVYGVVLVCAPLRTVKAFLLAALVAAPLVRYIVATVLTARGWAPEPLAYGIYSGSFLHADAFAAGALLAFAAREGRLMRLARPLAVLGFCALGLYMAVYILVNRAEGAHGVDLIRNVVSGILAGQHREVFLYSALTAACAGLVALAASRDRLFGWLLDRPGLQHVGEISYGAYVYHALAIVFAEWALSPFGETRHEPRLAIRLALFAIAYMITLAAAELSFRTFERRFLSRRRKPTAVGVAEETPAIA